MRKAQLLRLVLDSWWMAIVLFVVATLYLQGVHKKERVITRLQGQLECVESQRSEIAKKRTRLLHEIAAQSDPEWVEMVLMRKLGVVPEGQAKVCFK